MRGRRRWAVLASSLGTLIIVSLVVLVATRYYPAYRAALAAREDLRAAQAVLQDGRLDTSRADLAVAEERLGEAEERFQGTEETLDDPLLRAASRLPVVGSSLQATRQLTGIGIEAARLGQDAVGMTRAFQRVRDEGTGTLTERMDEIFAELEPSMAAIDERLETIHAKREHLTGAALPPALVSAIRAADGDLAEMDELSATYDDLALFVPDFLGFEGTRTYLVLAQNNAELLPTGGLISVYGIITVEDGRIQEKRFADAVSFGARWMERSGAYVEPPEPLRRYLLRDFSWNLAVSNWSPHFPSAAQEAERFIQLGGGQDVDGVIAINVDTIEGLLEVTGPITIEAYGVTVTAENALDVIEEQTRTALEPEGDRKAFVGVLAEELLSRLMRTGPERWMSLIDTVGRLRDQRQLLFFSHDRTMQMLSHRLAIDGALADAEGDYLMLVDASVQSTKLNIVLDQSIELVVRLDERGSAAHDVTVAYHNDLPAWSEGRDPTLVSRLMLGGVYGGYVRLLTPYGSELEGVALAGREVGPEERSVERGKAVFGRFFALPSGEETELTFRYSGGYVARREGGAFVYRLYLQKQPGTRAIPVRLRLILPEGAWLSSAEIDGAPLDDLGDIVADLEEDREIVVRYELDR